MTDIVASTKLIAKRAGQDPTIVTIEIGLPYKVKGKMEEWACPVSLSPLYSKLHDAHGGDSVQSICLAMSLVLDLLTSFVNDGGELFMEDGDRFPLEAYSFGVATRA